MKHKAKVNQALDLLGAVEPPPWVIKGYADRLRNGDDVSIDKEYGAAWEWVLWLSTWADRQGIYVPAGLGDTGGKHLFAYLCYLYEEIELNDN